VALAASSSIARRGAGAPYRSEAGASTRSTKRGNRACQPSPTAPADGAVPHRTSTDPAELLQHADCDTHAALAWSTTRRAGEPAPALHACRPRRCPVPISACGAALRGSVQRSVVLPGCPIRAVARRGGRSQPRERGETALQAPLTQAVALRLTTRSSHRDRRTDTWL
jgi:hypothetical protein